MAGLSKWREVLLIAPGVRREVDLLADCCLRGSNKLFLVLKPADARQASLVRGARTIFHCLSFEKCEKTEKMQIGAQG